MVKALVIAALSVAALYAATLLYALPRLGEWLAGDAQ